MKDFLTMNRCMSHLSTSSGGRELRDTESGERKKIRESTSSGGRELKDDWRQGTDHWRKVDLLGRS